MNIAYFFENERILDEFLMWRQIVVIHVRDKLEMAAHRIFPQPQPPIILFENILKRRLNLGSRGLKNVSCCRTE